MAAPTIKQLHLQTEGDDFKHAPGQASSAEKIHVYVQLANEDSFQETGPFGLSLTAGGHFVTGMTHATMGPGTTDEEWLSCGPLPLGQQVVTVTLESEDAAAYEWDLPTVEESQHVEVLQAHRNALPDESEYSRDWELVDLMITANNFLGKPLQGNRFYIRIVDTDGKTAAHDGTVDDGVISVPQIWVPKANGHIVLYVDTTFQGEHMRLESELVKFTPSGGSVTLKAVQEGRDIPVTASDEQSAAREAGVEGSIGVEIGVFQAGGGASSKESTSHTTGRSVQWTVRLPKDNLTLVAS